MSWWFNHIIHQLITLANILHQLISKLQYTSTKHTFVGDQLYHNTILNLNQYSIETLL